MKIKYEQAVRRYIKTMQPCLTLEERCERILDCMDYVQPNHGYERRVDCTDYLLHKLCNPSGVHTAKEWDLVLTTMHYLYRKYFNSPSVFVQYI